MCQGLQCIFVLYFYGKNLGWIISPLNLRFLHRARKGWSSNIFLNFLSPYFYETAQRNLRRPALGGSTTATTFDRYRFFVIDGRTSSAFPWINSAFSTPNKVIEKYDNNNYNNLLTGPSRYQLQVGQQHPLAHLLDAHGTYQTKHGNIKKLVLALTSTRR